MHWLELRVPPLLLMLLFALAMGLLARWSPWPLDVPLSGRMIAVVLLASLAIALPVAGVIAFRRAATTVDPRTPDAASQLVTGGIYQYTRNPMYLGFLLALLAWAAWLDDALALLALPLWVLWLNRWQIGPEERALASHFGVAFDDYCRRVRRWC